MRRFVTELPAWIFFSYGILIFFTRLYDALCFFFSLLADQTMKQIVVTICLTVFLFAKLTKATNVTNSTNASISTNSSSNATQVQLTKLYIGAFFDLSKKDGYGSLPMAQQAIEEINNNTSILPGYKLELVVRSTEVSYKNVQTIFNPHGQTKAFHGRNFFIFPTKMTVHLTR